MFTILTVEKAFLKSLQLFEKPYLEVSKAKFRGINLSGISMAG